MAASNKNNVGGDVLIPEKNPNGSYVDPEASILYPNGTREVSGKTILAAKNTVGRKSRRASRKNRKSLKSRKNRRTVYRRNRRNSRRNNLNTMMGGAYDASKLNLLQGEEYQKIHINQHGGALTGAPLSQIEGSMLDAGLRASARVGPLDSSLGEIRGMSDIEAPAVPTQKGGRRRSSRRGSRKGSRKNRKASRKNRKGSRKNRKSCRKNRRQRGGALSGAPLSAPSMLLNPFQAAKAGTADFSNPLLKD